MIDSHGIDRKKWFESVYRVIPLFFLTLSICYLLILIPNSFVKQVQAVSETRYFRSDTQTINGLSAYQLGTSQSSSSLSTVVNTTGTGVGTSYWGIRVWKRNSSGTETELTSGTPVAQVTRTAAGSGIQSTTWTPPETILATTDSIVVRVYLQVNSGGWQQGGTVPIFTTGQLGNTLLEALPWTVYYHTQDSRSNSGPPSSRYINITYFWGNSTYNSRIESFIHSSSSTVVTVGSYGTQRTSVEPNTLDIHMGGAFTFVRSASSTNVTSITISNTGTISDSNISGLILFYKQEATCSEVMPGDAVQFNSTAGTFTSGSSTVTGTMNVTASQVCLYVDMDIGSGAQNGDTIELQITNPSTQVSVSGGTVTPATAVAISGTTTVASNQGPSFTAFSDNGPKDPGEDITFTATSTDPNGDTVSLSVCKTTGYTTDTEWNVNFGRYFQSYSHAYLSSNVRTLFLDSSGTHLFVQSGAYSRLVYQFALSTAWDISSASYSSLFFDIPSQQDNNPEAIHFSSDGTKMYMAGDTGSVYQYTLTTAWNVSTATYASKSYSVYSQIPAPDALTFSYDGTNMYLVGINTDTVYQYPLSTAWDVSTASYTSKYFSVTSEEVDPSSVRFNSDGTIMYIVGLYNDTIYQYTLSTAWDVSTASYASKSFSVSAQETAPQSFFLNNDGTKFYITGSNNPGIYEYNIPFISCDGGASDTWCFSSLQASDPYCSYTIPIPTPDDTYDVYPYVFDMFDEPSSSSLQGAVDTFTVSNTSPILSSVAINGGSAINLTAGTTTAVTLSGTVTDTNSCYGTEISSVITNIYRSGIGTEEGSKSLNISYTDTVPMDIVFSSDGTKMYTVGDGVTHMVFQHTLSTAWDISTAHYASKSFYIGTQDLTPEGLAFSSDGTKMYVVGSSTDYVYQYTLSTAWDVSTASYSSKSKATGELTPSGITFNSDGTKMYIIGNTGDTVRYFILSTAWDISTANFSTSYSVSTQVAVAEGLYFSSDGTGMYVIDSTSDSVYQYILSTAWDISTASYGSKTISVATQDLIPNGISFSSDGTKMYMIGDSNNVAYQYTLATAWDVSTATYATKSFTISPQETEMGGVVLSSDGTKMYLPGGTNDMISQYTLSTAWDLSTATYAYKTFSYASQDTSMTSIFFSSDGTKMYLIGDDNNTVYQYTLSTAWDLSTTSYASKSFSIATQEDSPTGLFLSSNGLTMYITGRTNDTIYQYTLSTAWDVSTAAYASKSFSVLTESPEPNGITFSSDGTKMYALSTTNVTVYQYSLSTAGDVSTASYESKYFNVSSQDTMHTDFFLTSDGTKLYTTGTTGDSVFQYTLSTAYDISTASWFGNARLSCDAAGEANNNNCYPEITCSYVADSCTGVTDASANYTCTVNLQSYADPTDDGTPYYMDYWLNTLVATDDNSASSSKEVSTGVKLNSLIAFDITSSIFYGNLGTGSSNDPLDVTTTTTPTGNVGLDHEVYAAASMCTDFPTCAGSTISVDNQRFAIAASTAFSSATVLSTSPKAALINVAKPTSATPTTKNLWWGIYVPPTTDAGTFYGNITITGIRSNPANW